MLFGAKVQANHGLGVSRQQVVNVGAAVAQLGRRSALVTSGTNNPFALVCVAEPAASPSLADAEVDDGRPWSPIPCRIGALTRARPFFPG